MQALPPNPPAAAIVVTGTALPEAKAERVYSVERIDRRRMERSATHELDQLLKDVPGLQLFRRSDARSGHPTSQGVTLRALGGNASSRSLLVLDGVPQSDPFGGWVNWPAYDPLGLSGIRVVRGGGSVANGPGALAGTIEMTSRSDGGASGELDAGSRDALEARGRAGFELAGGMLSLSGRGERGDGFIPITEATRGPADHAAPYRQWSGRGRWAGPIAPATELQASVDRFHDWRNRGTDFGSDRTNGADASLRLVGRGAWQWSALGYWQWRNLKSSTASLSAGRTTASRVLLQDSVPSHGLGGSVEIRPPLSQGIELRLGADARRTNGETRELANFVAQAPTRRRKAGGETWTSGVFAEGSADLGSLTISGGARLDHWQVAEGHLTEQTIASGFVTRDEHYAKRDGWLPTARGGVAAPLGGGVSLRSAAYLGWRMPTLNELFRPFRAGLDATAANAALDPERLAGVEAGAQYANGPINLGLTAFANRLNDAIANVTLGHGPGIFPQVGVVGAGGTFRQRQNVDAVKVRGLELSAGWTRGPWSLRAGASLTHARMQASGAAAALAGLRPAQTPNFAATLAASWEQEGKGAEIALHRVGAQFEDDLNTRGLKGATTLDAFASWPLTRRLQLVARGENVTDALVMAGVGGDGAVERATPRTLWIGLRLR
ncbi:TonB-dependent receptor plug domain-containing protein [Sphingomonas sp. URHD0057]|uniref:TonB-dependent receptor plug domain-containing protein n=1 Tax=Sphingomonas sp. URHD0057 TaxID=1380389 RepID=UPI000B0DE90C|nr:TonB-dependent receptor [Sphingomonas sp. URHD0057]